MKHFESDIEEVLKPLRNKLGKATFSLDITESDNKLIKQYLAYVEITADLKDVKEMLKEQIDCQNELFSYSLFISSINLYGRCFTQAHGRKTSLKADDCFQKDKELLNYHKAIIEMRHSYLAHAGETSHKKTIATLLMKVHERVIVPQIQYEYLARTNLNKEENKKFIKVVDFLITHSKNKRYDKLNAFFKNITHEQMNLYLRQSLKNQGLL